MSHSNEIAALLMEEEADEEYAMFLGMTAVEEERVANERNASRHLGSVRGHVVIQRDRVQGHNRLYRDYFAEEPVYGPRIFRRRFRMHRPLFLRIASVVEDFDPYFVQRRNAAGNLGLSSLQKITAAMRMLAYGVSVDFVDDYVRIGESTTIESVKRFVKVVVEIFADEYLRSPNNDDIRRLLEIGEQRGFPGMLGSIDCMHWRWKNCPAAWHGMYASHVHEATIILEVVASYNLWIWHAFFGLLGSHNDINVLERSNLFTELTEGRAPPVKYSINSHEYTMGYYLADGIYPQWSTFVKTISAPQGNKRKNFAQAQESARKDVERAFGVLQARFAIVRGPARFWDQEVLKDIMKACIIMHNMIIEDERDINQCDFNYDAIDESPTISLSRERTPQLIEFIQAHHRIRDRQTHSQLQADLIEHLWQRHGGD
ncbi:putative nuclease HARBI1 [Asparagus officinalis]|uniref:putative nuclease HARBI1 n=1 Tax=Asparagus officinalis TaxID=4686 RepID=UPI00098E6741|nr:putative nuclease HARBI1 [Asparagus officinalis]